MSANSLENRRLVLTGLLAVPVGLALTGAPARAAGPGTAPPTASEAGQSGSNAALNCLMTRRSVRSFMDAPVSGELVRRVLAAGMQAPSAGNERPWQFVVVTDKARLASLAQVHAYVHFAAKAPLGIVVCADLSKARLKGYWPLDMSNCTMNILLAAHALGLGAVWTGVYPEEERISKVAEICATPEGIVPFALVVLGHPAQSPSPQDRFEAARVHDNKW